MRLLLTFQMHPSLRRRMLAPFTKRTKQSPCLNAMKSGVQPCKEGCMTSSGRMFECDEERSATLHVVCDSCHSDARLNAMKSGVQRQEGVCRG